MYVEDLLALNFMVNTFLLYLTARLAGKIMKYSCLVAGGFVAALYSLVIFLPAPQVFFSPAAKLAASLLIVAFTFRPHRIVELLRLCGIFFLASFFLGGAVFALHLLRVMPAVMHGGVFYLAPPRPGVIFAGVLVTFLLVAGVWHFCEKKHRQQSFSFMLQVTNGGQEVTLPALVDTGNSLRDPISGRPLCIAGYRALAQLLPPELLSAYEDGEDPLSVLSFLADNHKTRFGVVPYRTVENAGMMVTFRPQRVILCNGEKQLDISGTVFALSAKVLSADGDVEALLHPGTLNL